MVFVWGLSKVFPSDGARLFFHLYSFNGSVTKSPLGEPVDRPPNGVCELLFLLRSAFFYFSKILEGLKTFC